MENPTVYSNVMHFEQKKKEWMHAETMNTEGSMMLKPFFDEITELQNEVLCNGKDSIASHRLQSTVRVKLFDRNAGKYIYGDVKWIEPSIMSGCNCWDGIFIIAESDD
jgi:hypothetical protein